MPSKVEPEGKGKDRGILTSQGADSVLSTMWEHYGIHRYIVAGSHKRTSPLCAPSFIF